MLLPLLSIAGIAGACLPGSDAERYAAALSEAQDPASAARLCRTIAAEALRGDCLVAVMERWALLDPEGCTEIEDPLWRDECRFTLSERLWAAERHAEGLALCQQTRFARQCGYHLLQREVEAAADIGDPRAAEARLIPFGTTDTRVPDAPLLFWSLWFRRQARLERPIHEQDCADLQRPRACLRGMERYLHEILSAQTRAGEGCEAPLPKTWVEGPHLQASVARWKTQRCPPTLP